MGVFDAFLARIGVACLSLCLLDIRRLWEGAWEGGICTFIFIGGLHVHVHGAVCVYKLGSCKTVDI